jgi:hypothetical protein
MLSCKGQSGHNRSTIPVIQHNGIHIRMIGIFVAKDFNNR